MSELSFDTLFGDEKINIECPNCNATFSVPMKEIGLSVECPHCQVTISLDDVDNSFKEAQSEIDEALDEFEDILNSFNS